MPSSDNPTAASVAMTTHQGKDTVAGPAVDEQTAAPRTLEAQLSWDDPDQEPCPCGSSDGLHGEECDCEEGAVLIHTMRIPGSTEKLTPSRRPGVTPGLR